MFIAVCFYLAPRSVGARCVFDLSGLHAAPKGAEFLE